MYQQLPAHCWTHWLMLDFSVVLVFNENTAHCPSAHPSWNSFLSTLVYWVLRTFRLLSAHLFFWPLNVGTFTVAGLFSPPTLLQELTLIQDFLCADTAILSLLGSAFTFPIPQRTCLPNGLCSKSDSKVCSFPLFQ